VQRNATVTWEGNVARGSGAISASTGAFSQLPYSLAARVEKPDGKTSPEELLAAAHASCFSMALSGQLGNAGMTADSIETKATVTFEKTDAGFTITESHLETRVKVPNADKAKFDTAVNNAKSGCPISRVLNTKITLDAQLV